MPGFLVRAAAPEMVIPRIAKLSQDRSVLVVTARQPAATLREQVKEAGGDLEHLFVVDVGNDGASEDRGHHMAIASPTMLEMIAARVVKVIRHQAERPATILVDDVGTFSFYNPKDSLVQIVARAQLLTQDPHRVEFVAGPSVEEAFIDQLESLLDGTLELAKDGSVS